MTIGTATITDFLLARIAEDEAVAQKLAADHPYAATDRHWCLDVDAAAVAVGAGRAMAECAAKRRIVELHGDRDVSPSCAECGGYTATDDAVRGIVHHGYAIPWPCPTLRALASVYADHPDYRQEWKS